MRIEFWAAGSSETIMDAWAAKRGRGAQTRHMKDAQQKRPFLTNVDCSTIKTEGQPCSMVKAHASVSDEPAKLAVSAWMRGRQLVTTRL
jgi:hypothetical protein